MNRFESDPGAQRLRYGLAVACALCWVLGFTSIRPREVAAQTLTIAETEALVRAVYFEGLPEDESRRIGPSGAERLIEMLNDPEEASAHSNTLLALGLSGQPGAFRAMSDWASAAREGEIDRNTFRAWRVLPYALGHIAQHDRRAVVRLEALLDAESPNWSFRHHRGARLHRLARRAAATALGLSGLPESGAALDRAGRRASDLAFEEHLRSARALHRQRAATRQQ